MRPAVQPPARRRRGALGGLLPYRRALGVHWRDWLHNRRRPRGARHILVVRDVYEMHAYNEHYLAWLRERHPAVAGRLRLARLTRVPLDLGGTALVVPWLQDPLRERDPVAFARARALEERSAAAGINVVNPVEQLSGSIKSRALETIRSAGLRTARAIAIRDARDLERSGDELGFPVLVREDQRHGGPMVLARDAVALRRVDLADFTRPVALEYIETRSDDGLYRKYRYVMIGNVGVPRHLVISRDWCVHADKRVHDERLRREEIDYTRLERDPHHDALARARQALGLDVVAFDYAIDGDGRLVVWEPNPLPSYWGAVNTTFDSGYQRAVIERIYRALTRYYLERAGLGELAAALPAACSVGHRTPPGR